MIEQSSGSGLLRNSNNRSVLSRADRINSGSPTSLMPIMERNTTRRVVPLYQEIEMRYEQ